MKNCQKHSVTNCIESQKISHKRKYYNKMSDLEKVIANLQEIKGKNLGQNKDNLINFLMKGYRFNNDAAMN